MLNFKIFPEQASEFAPDYDLLFYTTSALTIFFTVVVGALVLFFAFRYKRGNKVDRSNPIDHNSFLELVWSVVPMFMALFMFAWSARKFVEARTPPPDAMEVYVVGKQWMWHMQHENGIRENNRLTVPVNRAVKLTMISQDVLHSLFVPQFRMKQDVIPGRYTQQWFKATKTGTYNLFCTEYCGTQHSEMGGYVRVLSEADWAKWVGNGGDDVDPKVVTLADKGKLIWEKNGCGTCHAGADTEHGPTLYGLIGTTRKFTDGSSVIADRNYVRDAIHNPYGKINAGYDKTMPDYKDMPEEDVVALYEYIQTLGSRTAPIVQDKQPVNP